jgi:hypothetical protein
VQAVYQYFQQTQGWLPAKTKQQVIDRMDVPSGNATEFDPDSIMLYAFPDWLMLDGAGTHANSKLSPTDISFVRDWYGARGSGPGPSGPPSDPIPLNNPGFAVRSLKSGQTAVFVFPVADADAYDLEVLADDPLKLSLFGPDSRTDKIADQGPAKRLFLGRTLQPGRYFAQLGGASGTVNYTIKVH